MKSEHRHELKTNELAEWIENLPNWFRENRNFILGIAAAVLVVICIYFWNSHTKSSQARQQIELTQLISQVARTKSTLARQQPGQANNSVAFLKIAEQLNEQADRVSNKQLAALALIKRAEALRAELHYKGKSLSKAEITDQIVKAKQSYEKALKKCSSNPQLTAMAQMGLGLCEEELGNFDKAREIYRKIVSSPELKTAVILTEVQNRLAIIDDYKQDVVFKPAPKPVAPSAADTVLKDTANTITAISAVSDTNSATVKPATIKPAGTKPADANSGTKTTGSKSDANAPAVKSADKPTDK